MESIREVSVIVPAYNESLSIENTIAEIKTLSGDFEVIIVDDGSTDGTFELLEGKDVKILRHRRNRGYGASLKTGIQNAKYDKIVVIDADGTYPYKKIPELIKEFEHGDFDMVVGARVKKNNKIPFMRRPARWGITKLANFLTEENIPDLNSGFRVIKKSVVENYIHLLPDGFSFTSTITLAMLSNGYNVKYVPINYSKRIGKSKIRPIHDTLNFILLIIRTVLYFNPLKIFLMLSLFLVISAFLVLVGSLLFLEKVMDITFGVILMTAVIVIAVGMLADLIDKRMR